MERANSWRNEEIEVVRTLAAEGLSASQIAPQIGASRNAVLGLMWRNGIQSKNRRGGNRPKRAKTEAHRVKKVRAPKPKAKPTPAPRLMANGRLAPHPFTPRKDTATPRMIDLVDLTSKTCKWPYGDMMFRFCGCPTKQGKPYCEAHFQLSLQNVSVDFVNGI